ncbi:MAG: UbiD family decarboxylase [Synergistaceae bacterium]|nr:UbiD family decarboxylase [Synergistaceae bacterium]
MLRAVLDRLKKNDDLVTCSVPVDPKFELGAVLSHFRNEQPILFSSVTGSKVSVAGALYGNRRIICDLLNTTLEDRIFKIMNAVANPGKPRIIDKGPVQENVIRGNIDLRALCPFPISNERDSGPYITAGIIAYRDIDSRCTHMAVRRFQVNEGNSLNVLVSGASPHLLNMLTECEKNNKTLECAVILGYDAAFLLSSQIGSQKYGLDKYAVDSAMRGEPLELVRCRSIDFEVPAYAEIVFEGVIHPGRKGKEGPFAELMGYYSELGTSPLMEITTVTHRNDYIFQHAFPCREEHLVYGMIKEAELYAALSSVVDVLDVNLTIGGGCRLNAVVSIRKRSPGDGKSAIITTLGAYKDIKHVVVVDEDVDIFDPLDVEFAISSRFQASTDLVMIAGALGSPLEASHLERGMTDKLGFDATKPLGAASQNYARAKIPGFENSLDINKYLGPLKKKQRGETA